MMRRYSMTVTESDKARNLRRDRSPRLGCRPLRPIVLAVIAALATLACQDRGTKPATLQPLPRLYVANEGSNSITVIDPATLKTVARVSTGAHPHNVNVDPLGRYFYVTNYHGDALQVFDVRTNSRLATVPMGRQPAHVVPDPSGKLLYVSSEGGTTLSAVTVPEFRTAEIYELKGNGPHGHVISPDGRFLLTPNSRSGNISQVDLVDKKIDLISLPPGAKPVAMGLDRDGKSAYVSDAGLNQVHKIDLAAKTVSGSLSVGGRPIQVPVHPTRPVLYVPCMEDGTVYKIDLENWKVEKAIPAGKGAHGIAYSPDGRFAYVTLTWEKPKGRVAVIDIENDRVLTTFEVEDSPNGIALLFGKNQGS